MERGSQHVLVVDEDFPGSDVVRADRLAEQARGTSADKVGIGVRLMMTKFA